MIVDIDVKTKPRQRHIVLYVQSFTFIVRTLADDVMVAEETCTFPRQFLKAFCGEELPRIFLLTSYEAADRVRKRLTSARVSDDALELQLDRRRYVLSVVCICDPFLEFRHRDECL